MFDRLPTPPRPRACGGVAPDHALTKGVEKNFDRVAAKKNFRYLLNVTVGQHIRHEELAARYHGGDLCGRSRARSSALDRE